MTLASKHDDDTDEGVARFVQQKKALACGLAGNAWCWRCVPSLVVAGHLDGEGDLSRTVFP